MAKAIAVQELVEGVNEAVNIAFSEETMAADMYYLEQLEVGNLVLYVYICVIAWRPL